jgi:hypothetical protein
MGQEVGLTRSDSWEIDPFGGLKSLSIKKLGSSPDFVIVKFRCVLHLNNLVKLLISEDFVNEVFGFMA